MQNKSTMSEIPTLQWLVDWANVGIVIALVASLVFGAASIFFGKRLNTIKDEQSALEKQASDERIAAANAEAAKALEGLSESNERIAGLNREAEALRAETEKAREGVAGAQSVAATANQRAAELEKQNLELRAGVAKLETEAADARRREGEAERARLELEQRTQPRGFSPEKFSEFVERVRVGNKYIRPTVIVSWVKGDNESQSFAHEVRRGLTLAGWDVEVDLTLGPNQTRTDPANAVVGVWVEPGTNEPDTFRRALVLKDAFAAAGFGVVFRPPSAPDETPSRFMVRVGTRPPSIPQGGVRPNP